MDVGANTQRSTGIDPSSGHTQPTAAPLLRKLEAGEQRTEGVLERIECGNKESATFHVTGPDGFSEFWAARMADVDFITYRDDLQGTVNCGRLKEPARVYVTWRSGDTAEAEKIAVAIEFLPTR
jgi:hypothetical protein